MLFKINKDASVFLSRKKNEEHTGKYTPEEGTWNRQVMIIT